MPQRTEIEVRRPAPLRERVSSTRLSTPQRVVDRLADLLFDADEILGMLQEEDAQRVRFIAARVRAVCEEIDAIMKTVVD